MAASLAPSYYDVSEKLNFYWTSLGIIVFASAVTVLRFVSLESLIQCWTPAQFENSQVRYTNGMCWLKEKYYLPMHEFIPSKLEDGINAHPSYHTYIPIMLVLMALGFQIPRSLKWILDVFLGSTTEESSSDLNRDKAEYLAQVIRESRQRSTFIRTLSFFFIKLLVGFNLLIQLLFISVFFRDTVRPGSNSTHVSDNFNIFPKIIMCDYQIQKMQNFQSYSVQCAMPVNQLYEAFIKIFWYWIIVLGIFTALVFVAQLASLVIPPLIKIRFRGIIPERELNQRSFGIDDSLLFLLDIQSTSGTAIARKVATLLYESPRATDPQKTKLGDDRQPEGSAVTNIPVADIKYADAEVLADA